MTTTAAPAAAVPKVRRGWTPAARIRSALAAVFTYGSLVAVSLAMLVPLVVIVIASVKTGDEFRGTGPFDLPAGLNLGNYVTAFVDGKMLRGFLNTMIILAISVTGTVLIGSMAAYALDRFEFRLRRTCIALFLLATLVPSVTTQVATFQVVNDLGLMNTRWAAIALFLGTDIIAIYIFMQFLRGIPRELDEAAAIDGANQFTIYRRIILPLLKPAIATVVIIKGITIYNEFYIPFLYMPAADLGVISTSLFRFRGPFGAEWEVICAGVIIVIVPTLLAFLALQRFIYNGFTSGAVK
jgi:ABC-type glycerol-3-phosphate transport system permease component